jgi:uncharacterized protein (TIGR03086 family)
MSFEMLERACASTGSILQLVRPDQMHDATPLPDWGVHELIDHIVGATSFFADVAESGVSPEDRDWPEYAAGDFVGSFASESGRLLRAFARPGVMERSMQLPIGPTPGSICILVATGEIFVHGWDLAKSTGLDTALDAEIADHLRASVWAELCDSLREGEYTPFGAAVAVAVEAPPADRLAGFLGRVP